MKLKKYHIYKVKHLQENGNEYYMVYLGLYPGHKEYNGQVITQQWSSGEQCTNTSLKRLRGRIFRFKNMTPGSIPLNPQSVNNEHSLEVLGEIPLSSIKMTSAELYGTTAIYYTNGIQTSAYLKPKKDYTKMRVLNQ